MRLIDEFLIRTSNDPVKYALRIVLFLGVVLLTVLLLFAPKALAQQACPSGDIVLGANCNCPQARSIAASSGLTYRPHMAAIIEGVPF